MASSCPPTSEQIVVSCLLPPYPEQLIVMSSSRSPPSRSPIKSIGMCLRQIVSFLPPPEHILCAEELLEPPIAPSSCCCGGCFISPMAKLTASSAKEAREGISDGVGWLLWPSSDDLEAIGHGFGGRSMS
jgi:hypothetical protein